MKKLIVLLLLAVTTPAFAQEGAGSGSGSGSNTPAGDAGKPWADGVSADDQKQASELFKEGNAFLRDGSYNDALSKYNEAITHWKHPAIYFNMVLALLAVGDAVQIYDALEGAMKYGEEGLGSKEEFESAKTYLKLVENQLVHVTVKCEEAGAKVFVDGKNVADCPGSKEQLLKAGEHTFAASKDGYETTTVDKVYPGGQTETIDLKLYKLADLTRYKRKFPAWISYTVIGVGVVAAGVGGLEFASGQKDINNFDSFINSCGTGGSQGCIPPQSELDMRDGASGKQTIGVVGMAVGGVAIAAGVTLLVVNRPQPYRVDQESREPRVGVVPVIGTKGGGVSAWLKF